MTGIFGQWLCNIGIHQPRGRGQMEGRSTTYVISDKETTTLSYLRCQRCGKWYPGSIWVPYYRRFP